MEAGNQGANVAAWRSRLPEGKLTWDQPGTAVVLETDNKAQTVGLEMVPTKNLSRTVKKVPISLQNVTDHPIRGKYANGTSECSHPCAS